MSRKTRKTSASLAEALKCRRWGVREAEAVLSAWRQSGESLTGFAGRHGLDAWRLMRWRRKLSQDSETIRFHPVQVVSERRQKDAGASGVELVLRHGRRLVLHRGFDAGLLENVVRAVESWSC